MSTAATAITIRDLRPTDWPEVSRIYSEGISTQNATFETEVPSWEGWDAGHFADHRFVAVDGERVVGWVAVSGVSDRCVYAGVVENSVYVAASSRGRGVGRALLERLIESTEAAGIWTIQTGVFPENDASLRLHESVGFTVVGRRKKIGKLAGAWRDVLFIERRSNLE